jgi:hypothetical protein
MTTNRIVLVLAVAVGLGIAFVDSRPNWDDTGITVLALVVSGAIFGMLQPDRPWLWAVAIGIWIPLGAIVRSRSIGSIMMLVVLAFPLAGAYAGTALRRKLALD